MSIFTLYQSASTNRLLKYTGLDDAVRTLYFQPVATINQNRVHSIFSSLLTLVVQVRRRVKHYNIPERCDALRTLYFQPGATINRNRFYSIFSLCQFVNFHSLFKYEYESPIKKYRTCRRSSDPLFSNRRDHNSKSLPFNIFFAGYTRCTSKKAISVLKYSGLERRCSDTLFSTRRDHKSKSLEFNIFFAVNLSIFTLYSSASTNRPLKYTVLERRGSDNILSTRRNH